MDDIDGAITAEDLRSLADIGFMAVSRGLDGIAEPIFAGLTAARPAGEAGPLGTALVLLQRGEAEAAVATLRALPPSDAAQLFLGMALHRAGHAAEAREVLGDLAGTAAEPAPAEAARAMLAAL